MRYTDANGDTWATVSEAARTVLVHPATIYVWVHRKRVRTHRAGVLWVNLDDVRDAELAWRRRVVARRQHAL